MAARVLIRGATRLEGARVDVRLHDGRVSEIAATLERARSEEVLDAAGGALLPGLHDHHTHLLAWAAARDSVACGPPAVHDAHELEAALRRAASETSASTAGWLRGVGYHESVAGHLDRSSLDAWIAHRPLRIQHRSGALWILNSRALEMLLPDPAEPTPQGVERDERGRPTGRLFRLDGWLRERRGVGPPPSLGACGRELCALGITGITDAGANNTATTLALLERARRAGELPQRLRVLGSAALDATPGAGERKILLDENRLPHPDELTAEIRCAHDAGRAVALHCVARAELVLALAALAEAGARRGDRLEHAAVAPPELVTWVARLGLRVVTQPGFIHERGDVYLRDVDQVERPWLYRLRAWLEAGVPLAAGSDAPFGDSDPWRAMRAACSRRTVGGSLLGASEALTAEQALALFLSPPAEPGAAPRRVAPGEAADLVLLDRPWAAARRCLAREVVAASWIGGRLVFRRSAC